MRASSLPLAVLVALFAAACTIPTDKSGELAVALDSVPQLLLQDTTRLQARLQDGAGAAVPNAVLQYAATDPGVLTVDSAGFVRAVGPGEAQVTVTAIEYAGATVGTQTVRVRDRLELDSVRPAVPVRFGQTLTLFGVGLLPDSLFVVQIGGVAAEVRDYVPDDPTRPQGAGQLEVWVTPPAPRRGVVNLLGFQGFAGLADSVDVLQRDLYEPNDTLAADLGSLPDGFSNPALALEVVTRAGTSDEREGADWYRFTNPTVQDRTIVFFAPSGVLQSTGVFVTDSLRWVGPPQNFVVGPGSWGIGTQLYVCGGLPLTAGGGTVTIAEQHFPLSIIALRDLPAGTYDVIAPYQSAGQPTRYEFTVANEYASLLAPDALEENDYCDVAKPLPASASLTIDNPHDPEWFRVRVAGPLAAAFTVTAAAQQNDDADLDLYLIRDFRPDSLVVVAAATATGTSETLNALLPPGDYFLLVVDFPGQATRYQLTSSGPTLSGMLPLGHVDNQLTWRRGLPMPARAPGPRQ